jgi:hypothetical protein
VKSAIVVNVCADAVIAAAAQNTRKTSVFDKLKFPTFFLFQLWVWPHVGIPAFSDLLIRGSSEVFQLTRAVARRLASLAGNAQPDETPWGKGRPSCRDYSLGLAVCQTQMVPVSNALLL